MAVPKAPETRFRDGGVQARHVKHGLAPSSTIPTSSGIPDNTRQSFQPVLKKMFKYFFDQQL